MPQRSRAFAPSFSIATDRVLLVRFDDAMGELVGDARRRRRRGGERRGGAPPRARRGGRACTSSSSARCSGPVSTGTSTRGASAASGSGAISCERTRSTSRRRSPTAELAAEGVHEVRWFTLDELAGEPPDRGASWSSSATCSTRPAHGAVRCRALRRSGPSRSRTCSARAVTRPAASASTRRGPTGETGFPREASGAMR